MDPLTQASIGAAAAVLFCRRENTRLALTIGALAGLAPDLDVLISSESDPLLALQYHRHFTHSIFFAPLIGLLVAGLWKLLFYRWRQPFKKLATFAIAGVMTHGLIDACTSYGTLLYWPISNHRESWDIISIIDPIFTLPLVGLLVLGFAFRRPWLVKAGLFLCGLYLTFGVLQRQSAENFAYGLAESRGHSPEQLTIRPSFANTLLWRTVYREGPDYYIDAVQIQPGSAPVHYPGFKVQAFTERDALAIAAPESTLANDIERFRFFSQGYLSVHPENRRIIGDARYAMLPNSPLPLWGIEIDPSEPNAHVTFAYYRDASKSNRSQLWQMIRGRPLEPTISEK
jgi:inner membrane protein